MFALKGDTVSSTFPICNTELVASEFARLRREKKARHRDIAEELGCLLYTSDAADE